MGHYSHHFHANQMSANKVCEIENINKAAQHTATGQRAQSLLLILSASITLHLAYLLYCYYFPHIKSTLQWSIIVKSISIVPLQIRLLFSHARLKHLITDSTIASSSSSFSVPLIITSSVVHWDMIPYHITKSNTDFITLHSWSQQEGVLDICVNQWLECKRYFTIY